MYDKMAAVGQAMRDHLKIDTHTTNATTIQRYTTVHNANSITVILQYNLPVAPSDDWWEVVQPEQPAIFCRHHTNRVSSPVVVLFQPFCFAASRDAANDGNGGMRVGSVRRWDINPHHL